MEQKNELEKVTLPNYLRPTSTLDNIRLGRDYDGGYIVPKSSVKESDLLLSFGINLDWSFEIDYAKVNTASQIVCYDSTTSFLRAVFYSITRFLYYPVSRKSHHLKALNVLFSYPFFWSKNVTLFQKFVKKKPTNEKSISIVEVLNSCHSNKIFLKIDIEGDEYEIIDELVLNATKFTAVAIEFHNCGESKFKKAAEALLNEFYISHIHINNAAGLTEQGFPHLLEISFVNKKKTISTDQTIGNGIYKHEDDMPNVKDRQDFLINFN